ncbi:MAG: hypothetical protein Q8P03_00420 [bacterium]|nr:hypothetical protein [bacterium]
MPNIYSSYWNEQLGVCEKHHLPQLPCQQCLAEHDVDITVRLTETEHTTLDFDPALSVRDLLPAKDGDWLLERVVA